MFQKNGRIGIHNTNPEAALHIGNTSDRAVSAYLLGNTSNGQKGIHLHYNNDPASAAYEHAVIDARAQKFSLRGVAPNVG